MSNATPITKNDLLMISAICKTLEKDFNERESKNKEANKKTTCDVIINALNFYGNDIKTKIREYKTESQNKIDEIRRWSSDKDAPEYMKPYIDKCIDDICKEYKEKTKHLYKAKNEVENAMRFILDNREKIWE